MREMSTARGVRCTWPRRTHTPSPCCVGSLAPDLGYLLGVPARWSHEGFACLAVDACIAAVFTLWWLGLAAPTLRTAVGSRPLVDWSAFVREPARPSIAIVLLSFVLGAGTHVVWDGLTHMRGWPATMYGDRAVGGLALPLFLWKWSSYAGAIVLAVFLRRAAPPTGVTRWTVGWDHALALAVFATAMALAFALAARTPWNTLLLTLRLGFAVATASFVLMRWRRVTA